VQQVEVAAAAQRATVLSDQVLHCCDVRSWWLEAAVAVAETDGSAAVTAVRTVTPDAAAAETAVASRTQLGSAASQPAKIATLQTAGVRTVPFRRLPA